MSLKKRLGLRIKELRIKNKLTQAQLAEKMNIATKTQGFIETGRSFPSAKLIEKYAIIFKVDVSEIMDICHIVDDSGILSQIKLMISEASQKDIVIIYKFLKSLLH